MKAVVVFPPGDFLLQQLAEQVCAGAREAGAEVELISTSEAPQLAASKLVFLGISAYGLSKRLESVSLAAGSNNIQNASIRLFCVHSGSGKKILEEAQQLLESRKLSVKSTLLIECKGLLKHFGRGVVGEGDLARARAFGERGAAAFLGRRVPPENEKRRISGYLK